MAGRNVVYSFPASSINVQRVLPERVSSRLTSRTRTSASMAAVYPDSAGRRSHAGQRRRVARLVEPERSEPRHVDVGEHAPALVADLADGLDALAAQLLERRLDVVAHQVEL